MFEKPMLTNEISEEIPLTRERKMTHIELKDYNFTERKKKIDANVLLYLITTIRIYEHVAL